MAKSCIGIYGETCAGKSTLGKMWSESTLSPYISFGDLKRREIASGTKHGKEIANLVAQACPIPAELGFNVISSEIKDGLNFVSGYPISEDEFRCMSRHVQMLGVVVLDVSENVLLERFGSRRQCPKCDFPGSIGDLCPLHGIPMEPRSDTKIDELIARRSLFRKRINTFLESTIIRSLPQLRLDGSNMSKEEVAYAANQWLLKLLITQKGEGQ